MKLIMPMLLLSFVIPLITFAEIPYLPCMNPLSNSSKPESLWNCTGYPPVTTGDLSGANQGTKTGTNNATNPVTSNPISYNGSGVGGLFDVIQAFLSKLLTLLISLAIVWFVYNVFQYTIAGDEAKKKEAKEGIVSGLVGIFVMVSIWGLVAILQSTFNIFPGRETLPNLKTMFPTF